jgi:Sec-independent protein translocase protein TatA
VLAFLDNIGLQEMLLILVVAVLIFGKDLPQAASKAYLQARKLRNAVDDLRRDSGIDREIRDIERTVREAEWEARRAVSKESLPRADRPRPAPAAIPAAPSTPAEVGAPQIQAPPSTEANAPAPAEPAAPESPPSAAS